ncbi:MAG: Transposase [Verrucomicrobiales bacterium]|nr:Transposase [Verrucomicrobiales bacterium]
MSLLNIKEFYGQSLGVTTPWKVTEVSIDSETRQVRVRVECARGVPWVDPETRERAEIKDWQERTWRHLDTCDFETVITAKVPRIILSGGRTMMVSVPWAEAGGRFTRSFERRVIELLLQCRTVSGAARLARLKADAVDGVLRRAVERGLSRRAVAELKNIGLDEKAIRKGHKYATILTDIDSGAVIDVAEDRTREATAGLLTKLPERSLAGVEAVAMDMWPAFIGAVEELLPEASVVFDKFHIKKHLNEAVDKVRKSERRELGAAGSDVLKNTKYQWLRNHDDMRLRAEAEFRELLSRDLKTGTAWALKENFDRLWSYSSLAWALKFLWDWVEAARGSKLSPMAKAADMVERHAEGILNFLWHPITNAAAEGINSIIQSLKHAARGLPNFESFRSRILFFLSKLDLSPA